MNADQLKARIYDLLIQRGQVDQQITHFQNELQKLQNNATIKQGKEPKETKEK